jgi:hypothetical protein
MRAGPAPGQPAGFDATAAVVAGWHTKSGDAVMTDYQIKGQCTGYKRGFEFELTNGQTWAQTCSTYEFNNQHRPDVTLEVSGRRGRLTIAGMASTVDVKRIR